MSDLKFQPILDSYEQLGVNVGDTHRYSEGLAIFNAVQADFILWTKQRIRRSMIFLGFKVMAAMTKLVKYGEIPWPQSADPKHPGEPGSDTSLEWNPLSRATCLELGRRKKY